MSEPVFPFDPGPYEVTIERHARWGPFAWYITFTRGLCSREPGRFAWTEKRAKRTALRLVSRWQQADQRRVASRQTFSVGCATKESEQA